MELGRNLGKQRKERDITQSELAERIGVSKSLIGRIENDTYIPSLSVMVMLADALGVSIDELVGRRAS